MADGLLQPLNRERLADQVYQVLVRYILRTGAQIGDRLPSERKFSEILEVSRAVVRSAQDRLVTEGYVEKQPGVGMILRQRPPHPTVENGLDFENATPSLQDLYQARIALEVGAIEWVVPGLTDEDLDKLDRLVDQIAIRVKAGASFTREDREFHNTLIRACANPVIIQLASIIDQYFDHVRTYFAYYPERVMDHSRFEMLDVRHRMIVMSLRARDVEAARHSLRFHFRPWRF